MYYWSALEFMDNAILLEASYEHWLIVFFVWSCGYNILLLVFMVPSVLYSILNSWLDFYLYCIADSFIKRRTVLVFFIYYISSVYVTRSELAVVLTDITDAVILFKNRKLTLLYSFSMAVPCAIMAICHYRLGYFCIPSLLLVQKIRSALHVLLDGLPIE